MFVRKYICNALSAMQDIAKIYRDGLPLRTNIQAYVY